MMAMTRVPSADRCEHRVHAAQQVDTGRHHGGGVDERRDRRRALHGVGQPVEERDLGRLAGGGQEEQQHGGRGRAPPCRWRELPEDAAARSALVLEGARLLEDQEDGEQEAGVTDAVVDEGLLARRGGRVLLEPEGDQPVGADAHALPADEGEQQVVRQDQHQHGEDEEVQVDEELRVVRGRPSCTRSEYRWISVLTPVMNRHMVIDSGSTSMPTGTCRPPAWNQVK